MEHHHKHTPSCHAKKKFDYLLWGALGAAAILYALHVLYAPQIEATQWLSTLSGSVYELTNTIWWGVILGIIMVALLSKVPREFVISILGRNGGFGGIVRATLGGVLLDLCSHGILMVGAKLYERGASAGQLIAFLVASPWNSFSLTLVLVALIGLPWTLAFIGLSLVIAIITGVIFDALVSKGTLPANPNKVDLPEGFRFWSEARKGLASVNYSAAFFTDMAFTGLKESRMVLRWIFFGVILASLIRAFVDTGDFQTYFGPTLAGLGLTVLAATIIEVCSEGSTPIAADILTRANAPGNSFAFLMTGVATDYTEIMVLKETTKSWKLALFLPLITVPQVILMAWLMNYAAV
jgi:uncharacterized membrane protein YraQ (UPF0718 family)